MPYKIIVLCLRSNMSPCFTAILFTGYAICMFGLYSFMPVVIKITSATSVNLGILTSDLYSLFLGLFLFKYKVSTFLHFHIPSVTFLLQNYKQSLMFLKAPEQSFAPTHFCSFCHSLLAGVSQEESC